MVAKWLLQLQTFHPSIGWHGKRRTERDPSPHLPVTSEEYLSQDHLASVDQSLAERNDTAITGLNQVLLGICSSSSALLLYRHVHCLCLQSSKWSLGNILFFGFLLKIREWLLPCELHFISWAHHRVYIPEF